MDPDSVTLSELIAQCAGTPRGKLIETLIQRLQPLVAGVVSHSLRRRGVFDGELVKDLSQEVFLKLLGPKFRLKERTQGRSDGEICGLIRATAANLVADALRGVKPTVPIEEHLEAGKHEDADLLVLVQEVDEAVKRVVKPPHTERDYRIFWLYHRHRMTAREISLLPGVGLSVKGVESAIVRITAEVKAVLIGEKGIPSKGAF